jgi:transposase
MSPRKPNDPKLEALLAQGTANPRPQDVRDPAFQESEFFDARDLVQVKYEMLRRVRSEGHAVADAASKFGVSRPTFYKAQTDFVRAGIAGLIPAKRGPRGPHKLSVKVMAYIARILAKDPSVDAAELVDRVEQKLGVRVHRRTIERALARSKKKAR